MEELYRLAPLLALNPAADNGGGIDLSQCRITDRNSWIHATQTIVLEESDAASQDTEKRLSRRHWLDPNREFCILRSATYRGERLREQIDIEYVEDAECGWRPAGWTVISRPPPARSTSPSRFYPGNERLFDHASAAVTAWEAKVPEQTTLKKPQFPVGTAWFDQISEDWLRQTGDTTTQPLDKDSVMLMASGEMVRNSGWSGRRWLILISVALALVFMVFRRRRLRKIPQ